MYLGKAHTLADLIQLAKNAESKFGEQVWFRGHANNDWKLIPSAHRRNSILEAQFLNHFRLKAPALSDNCPNQKNYSAWLPLMQHYGLPTRLLDWTESLLVATYFALNKESINTDVVLWILSPGVFNKTSVGGIIPFLTDERIQPLIESAFNGKPNLVSKHTVAVIAPRTDKRMAAQLGNYTIHGNRSAIEDHPNATKYLAKIIIPMKAVSDIKQDLSIMGVRQSSLFPDLSNLAQEISGLIAFDKNGNDVDAHEKT